MKLMNINLLPLSESEFTSLKETLNNTNLPTESQQKIQKILADYEEIVRSIAKVFNKQNETAGAMTSQGVDPHEITPIAPVNSEKSDDLPDAPSELEPTEPAELPDDPLGHAGKNDGNEPSSANPSSKKGKKPIAKGKMYQHALSPEEKICPSCLQKMSMSRPKTQTIAFVASFLQTRTDVTETCHCEKCGVSAEASLPEFATQTIGRYHHSAVAHMIALRYQYGMASYRLEDYLKTTGLRVSDSTQWTLFEEAGSRLKHFHDFLIQKVANCNKCHMDDTHQKIISVAKLIEDQQNEARKLGKDPSIVRSGIHTTNVTAVYEHGQIVLFHSGLHHAGEFAAKLLEKRSTKEELIVMADASSSNMSEIKDEKFIKQAKCNSHTVRKFKDQAKSEQKAADDLRKKDHKTSEKIDFFIRTYKRVFAFEKQTENMTPEQRQIYHKTNSYPLMLAMKEKIEDYYRKKIVEPSSDLGKIYNYYIKHFPELCAFCEIPNAPIDNNLSERMLKCAIRHRKNSLFFKNLLGAKVGDIFASILITANANGLNSIQYVEDLLNHRNLWKQNPEAWLPWNYLETKAKLKPSPT